MIEKWFYAYVDLIKPNGTKSAYDVDSFLELIPHLAQCGYGVIVLSSFQLCNPALLTEGSTRQHADLVQRNLKAIITTAKEHQLEVIPEVMQVGHSEPILDNDPNLAEGTPVEAQLLELQEKDNGQLQGVASSVNLVRNGDFAEGLSNWIVESTPEDAVSTVQTGPNAEFPFAVQLDFDSTKDIDLGQETINLKPRHQYRVRFWAKTQDLEAPESFYLAVSGKESAVDSSELAASQSNSNAWYNLSHVKFELKSTQDWTEYRFLFNSYNLSSTRLWFGINGCDGGKLWIAGIRLQAALGCNLLRRDDPGTEGDAAYPVQTTSATITSLPVMLFNKSTQQQLREDVDFKCWSDEKTVELGFTHDKQDVTIQFLPESIQPSDQIEVSYYHANLPTKDQDVCCSLRHPRVFDIFREQLRQIQRFYQPSRWMLGHNEIRTVGHDPLTRNDPPAKIINENFKACCQIVEELSPGTNVIAFSDMFDPYHNAVERTHKSSYYPMVNGDLNGTSLERTTRISVLNWCSAEHKIDCDFLKLWKGSVVHFSYFGQIVSAFYDKVAAGDVEEAAKTCGSSEHEAYVRERTYQIFQAAKGSDQQIVGVCYYSTKKDACYVSLFAQQADEVWGV